MARLFGTDGVRGVANTELTPELAFKLGQAAAIYFSAQNDTPPMILIGRDTRISGSMLEAALAAGICSGGGNAVLAGVIPTPAVAYLTRELGAQAGVVISASHNPFPDNGIKFFSGTGYKLPDATEDELEKLVCHPVDLSRRPTAGNLGTIISRHELIEKYIDYAARTVALDLSGIRIVLDCANGAAYEIAPRILRRLGADLIVLNDMPTGININDHCGSTHLDMLQQAVVSHSADIGIAHDGDADRCLVIDEQGRVVDGDHIMVICALALMAEGKLADNTLVATVMSNLGLHHAIRRAGGKVAVTPVGDRYVLEEMLNKGYVLGGEQSGHIIFSEYSTTGDGILTALQLLSALVRSGKRLSELARVMTRLPQLLVNIRVKSKEGWEENAAIAAAIAAGEAQLGDRGRLLIRPSGTEPLIRVMGEGPDPEELKALVHRIADVIRAELT